MKLITCQYCRAENHSEDHRCRRCGRRTLAASEPTPTPVLTSALAPALAFAPRPLATPEPPKAVPELVSAALHPAGPAASPVQASLFGLQEVPRSTPLPSAGPTASSAPRSRREPATPRRDTGGQPSLEFHAPAPDGNRLHATSSETALYRDAPVALVAHRVMACLVDVSLSLAGFGLFLGVLHLAGNESSFGAMTVPAFALAAVIILLLYRLLFCIANADTPGTRWCGLRILNFDGHAPTPRQRFIRMLGGIVSVIASGLGLLWALVDEERLTWHDHMSETFPVPVPAQTLAQTRSSYATR